MLLFFRHRHCWYRSSIFVRETLIDKTTFLTVGAFPYLNDLRTHNTMTSTTYPSFGENTEGLEVAKAFTDSIRGKTVLVTGVNRNGVGFTTAQAFVSSVLPSSCMHRLIGMP